jgi:hypothetical protein
MPELDTASILNWAISGLIGLIFGAIGSWYTHRLQLSREKLAWQREKERLQEDKNREREMLQERFEQEKILLKLKFQQEVLEREKQFASQQSSQVRAEILKGTDNPAEVIRRFENFKRLFSNIKPSEIAVKEMDSFLDKETISLLVDFLEEGQHVDLEALRESVNKIKDEFDNRDISEKEFQGKLGLLIKETMRKRQNTG